jgi:HlyD family secretion protein
MKKVIRIVLILAVLGGAAYWWYGRMNANPNRLLVSGNLELTLVDISFKIAGRMTDRYVDEGDRVKKGEVIARLDPLTLKRQASRDRAIVSSAQSSYDQLVTSVAYQRATLEADISAHKADLAAAQARLDAMTNGSRPQDIKQTEAAVGDARAQLEFARLDWERSQTLFKNEDISRQQYDQARTHFESAGQVLRQAEERYSMMKEGPRQEDIAAGRAEVAKAVAAVATAEANRLELQRKEQELVARRAEIDRARDQAGVSDSQVDDTVVTTPIDGVVLVKSAEAGEVLAAGTSIVTVGDLEHPWLRGYINESDLGRIKIGQKVKLTTDSYPGKFYDGHISFIASEAEFTPKQIQTKEERVKLVYRIKIDVDNSSLELKNNMPVDAEIVL